tara:strand:+ start:363 stop:518 length:156 start_codon:yes stop_codon:yes gene_type:complete
LQIGKALAFMSKGAKIAGKLWSLSGRVSKNFFETTRENVTEGLSLRRDHAI